MKAILGECIGTFFLVFLGCGSVAYSIFIEPLSLYTIAAVWGVAVCGGIFISAPYSKSHLNPAVSLAFVVDRSLDRKELPRYLLGQLTGALLAGLSLALLFGLDKVGQGVTNAMYLGEYYPNPGNANLNDLGLSTAFGLEMVGALLLMVGIYLVLRFSSPETKYLDPVLIGAVVSVLIIFIAPYTQCGINPARDFGPRLVSFLCGYDQAFSYNGMGWLIVYILAPIAGATSTAFIKSKLSR